MPATAHTFRIKAAVGATDVLKSLQHVCGHDSQRDHDPAFEFDWIKRRIALVASSPSGVASLREAFLARMEKLGAPADALLPGIVTEADGRYTQPFGVALHDAATFGELIGRSLVEIGLRGVRVFDAVTHCDVLVRQGAAASSVPYADFVAEFPVPPYVAITDEGIGPMPELPEGQAAKQAPSKRKNRKKR
jgi:hypothetical protein